MKDKFKHKNFSKMIIEYNPQIQKLYIGQVNHVKLRNHVINQLWHGMHTKIMKILG